MLSTPQSHAQERNIIQQGENFEARIWKNLEILSFSFEDCPVKSNRIEFSHEPNIFLKRTPRHFSKQLQLQIGCPWPMFLFENVNFKRMYNIVRLSHYALFYFRVKKEADRNAGPLATAKFIRKQHGQQKTGDDFHTVNS
jgi:hypothetical protein